VPDTASCTSEDECKWFFYYHMIYSPETNNQNKTLFSITIIKAKRLTVVHNLTYSMHDEVLMSHRTRLVVLLAPPWTSCHSRCCRLTAYLAPHWVGQVPPPPPHSWWPHFSQGPRTLSSPCLLQYRPIQDNSYIRRGSERMHGPWGKWGRPSEGGRGGLAHLVRSKISSWSATVEETRLPRGN
jgi:hypothetical protein